MASDEQDRDVAIQVTGNFETIDISPSKVEELVKTVCDRFAGPRKAQGGYEVSIAIVDDAEITRLNTQFLNHKETTDCLSFDLSDDEEQSEIENRKSKIFDLIINGEMALRQAESRGHSSEAELALYITHGLLHNFGFDDSTPEKARKMHETEDEILQQMGYGFVYNNEARAQDHTGHGN